MAQPTQGTWIAHEQQSKFGTLEGYYVVENGRVQIADLFGIIKGERDEGGNEVFISTDEAAANARLIAKSPDLLQAAKDASQMLHALAAVANQMPPKYFAMVQAAMPQGYGDLDALIAEIEGGAK